MKNIFYFVFLILFFVSCKTTQIVTENKVATESNVSEINKKHNQITHTFSTLSIRATAKYKDNQQSQSVVADIRIQKDSMIWINIKFLGFPAAKAIITPEKVSYYEKLNKTYFDGDFTMLSNWLGTDLDFQKVQNLLLGKALEDFSKDDFTIAIIDKMYCLASKDNPKTEKSYFFEGTNYLLKKEVFSEKEKNRSITIAYPSFNEQNKMFFPTEINIAAIQDESVWLDFNYQKIEVNPEVNFPFTIPNDYKKITIE